LGAKNCRQLRLHPLGDLRGTGQEIPRPAQCLCGGFDPSANEGDDFVTELLFGQHPAGGIVVCCDQNSEQIRGRGSVMPQGLTARRNHPLRNGVVNGHGTAKTLPAGRRDPGGQRPRARQTRRELGRELLSHCL
jgi:hypothetical protein